MIMDYVHPDHVRGKKILDVGCGIGSFILSVLDWQPLEAIGIDVTIADVNTAAEHVKREGVRFQISSALELPFPDESFDTVTSWEVLEHIPRNTEGRFFAEIYRVLKPGGKFYLSTPHRTFWSCVGDPAWWLVGHRHYSRPQIVAMTRAAGFRLEDLGLQGGFWAILQSLNMYVAKWVFRRKPFLDGFFNRKLRESFRIENETGFTGLRASFTKVVPTRPN